jgi:hypothetical protein
LRHEVNDRILGPVAVVIASTVSDEPAMSPVLAQMKRDGWIAGDFGISEWPGRYERIVL